MFGREHGEDVLCSGWNVGGRVTAEGFSDGGGCGNVEEPLSMYEALEMVLTRHGWYGGGIGLGGTHQETQVPI